LKALSFILALSLLTMAPGCGGRKSVKGTWEMVYPEPAAGAGGHRHIKVLTDTHFAFGSRETGGGIFAGGGTYSFTDSTYTENIQYHTLDWLVGQRLEFKHYFEDGKWYHSGTFAIKGRRFTVNEIWEKVDD